MRIMCRQTHAEVEVQVQFSDIPDLRSPIPHPNAGVEKTESAPT